MNTESNLACRRQARIPPSVYEKAAQLQRRVADDLLDRLDLMSLNPRAVLEIGSRTGYAIPELSARYPEAKVIALDPFSDYLAFAKDTRDLKNCDHVAAQSGQLPLPNESIDLVFSNLVLLKANTIPVLEAVYRVLRPGGLFLFSAFGPDTLREFVQSWEAHDDVPHVHDFHDMHDLGDSLVAAGYAEPVMDVDWYTVTYSSAKALMTDLKVYWPDNPVPGSRETLTGKGRFGHFKQAYESLRGDDGHLPSTWEIVYGHAWMPTTPRKIGVASASQRVAIPD